MRETIIHKPDGSGYFVVNEGDGCEFADPVEETKRHFTYVHLCIQRQFGTVNMNKALAYCDVEFHKIMTTSVPKPLIKLLECQEKKEQQRLLKGLSITSSQLTSFICKAGIKHGYKYSFYKGQRDPEGLDETMLPLFIRKEEDGSVFSIGETELSNGQLRNSIDHRTLICAKFLDRDEQWHCFYYSDKSIRGEESNRKGDVHIHYLSSEWMIPREQVVKEFKRGYYRFSSPVHIGFIRYE